MDTKKRVVIALAPQMLREFLGSCLTQTESFSLEVVAELEDGMEAVVAVNEHAPDLLIVGLALPRLSGISVINAVRPRHPEMVILVLTDYEDEIYVLEAFQAGANGYCIKDSSMDEMMLAIESVLAGKKFISPGITSGVLGGYLDAHEKTRETTDWDTITQREREVLKLVAEGYKNKEIAEMLHISCKTVEKHRSNIMSKLGIRNVASLTTYAIDKGLVKVKA
ncbi:LuxR C-terminal-related transcriptional regulator [Desulfonatronum thioautotrophicum]|uniref:LuxR C-terminal-related transcriptional regulator n=1 Tax=Desulfonatronum thioautotrophicum TaxID=617001 RepID=UPI0005EBAD52|nr:response regulator transcription factor [Desulfonatronum thioautotrophicum]